MSFTTEIPVAAKRAILCGVHERTDKYFVALYEKQAPRDKYSANGEVRGQGYTPGGRLLSGRADGETDGYAWLNWSDTPRWERASITAREALIYNHSKGGAPVCVLVLDQAYTAINGAFELEFPASGLTSLVVL